MTIRGKENLAISFGEPMPWGRDREEGKGKNLIANASQFIQTHLRWDRYGLSSSTSSNLIYKS